jgi:hypothetical protein
MNKYYFSFAGCVEVSAKTLPEAEAEFIKLNQFELADNFSELEVTITDENGIVVPSEE